MHGEPERAGIVADVEHDPVRRDDPPEKSVDAAPEPKDVRSEAEFGKHRKAGRLQHEAGADRARLGELVEERDPVAIARQEERRSQAGRAAPGDRHLERLPLLHRAPAGAEPSADA